MQRVKKQHYVPRLYLRRFTYDGSRLFVYDTFSGRSYGTNIADAASANYFNDAPLDPESSQPGDRDPLQKLEHYLVQVEGAAATALDLLIRGIEQNSRIDPSSRPDVARFLAAQVLRTQEARVGAAQIWERLKEALHGEQLAPSFEEWLARGDRPDGAAITQSHLLLDSMNVQTIAEILLEHIWLIGLNNTGAPLWTSDHPVVRKAHFHDPLVGSFGLASPGIEIDFPLSPTMVLILAERTFHQALTIHDGRTMTLIPDNVVYLNSQQAVQCYQFVYAPTNDFTLVDELRQQRPELFRPDRNRVEVVAPARLKRGTSGFTPPRAG